MERINGEIFPVFNFINSGLGGQNLGFPSESLSKEFVKDQEYYVLLFETLSFRFHLEGSKIIYLGEQLKDTIDNVLGKSLWGSRNDIDSGCGLLLTVGGGTYLYSIDNDFTKETVTWSIFLLARDIFLHFSTGNWKYSDLATKKMWFDNRTIDFQKETPGYGLNFPIQMVHDVLTYIKSAQGETGSIINPGEDKKVEDILTKNETKFPVLTYGI